MDHTIAPVVAAFALASAYAGGRWLMPAEGAEHGLWSRRRRISTAAGVSVAYVFVDVLPELGAQNQAIVAAAGGEPLLFAEQRVYLLALLSFVVLYGIEHLVLASRRQRGRSAEAVANVATYGLHLGGFAAYSALIGYLLSERFERGPVALAVYTIAMAVHFLIVDHSMFEQHRGRYARAGRPVLAASVLAGALLGIMTTLPEAAFARLFALLAGGVVITSLRAELPDEREGRFWPFCLGAVVFAAILLFA